MFTLKLKFSSYLQWAYLASPYSSSEAAGSPSGESQGWKWTLVCTGTRTQKRDPTCCKILGRVVRWQYTQMYIYHTL